MVYDEEKKRKRRSTHLSWTLYTQHESQRFLLLLPKPSSDLYYPPFRSSNADRVCNDDMVLCVDER